VKPAYNKARQQYEEAEQNNTLSTEDYMKQEQIDAEYKTLVNKRDLSFIGISTLRDFQVLFPTSELTPTENSPSPC
jgi:hypothetical protein